MRGRGAGLRTVLRGMYHFLPDGLRTTLAPLKAHVLLQLRHPRRGPLVDQEGVTVAGLFSTACGLGEAARLHAAGLEAMGSVVERLDLSPYLDDAPCLEAPPAGPMLARGPVIIHLNPPQFREALVLIGRKRLRGRQIIANWNWELERVPAHWAQGAEAIDEFWAPSQFTADAITAVLQRPARVVPYPVLPSGAKADRARFGLPAERFVALTFMDLRSNIARKNPFAALDAFAQAAADPAMPPCCLAVKLAGAREHPEHAARLQAAINFCAAPVVVIDQFLPRELRDSLVASADVLLSLHRSEGFGLTLAEAMLAGKRAIGTAWSGNMEFMNAENAELVPADLVAVEDSDGFYDRKLRWAEPDVTAAARALVRAAGKRAAAPVPLDLQARFAEAVRGNAAIARLADAEAAVAPPAGAAFAG